MSRRLVAAALLACCASGAFAAGANVVFVSIRGGDPQLYVREGTGPVRAITSGKSLPAQPVWSADNRVAYAARVAGSTRIFIAGPEGGEPRRLTAEERMESSPSWSPDGRALAYYSRRLDAAGVELRVTEIEGGRTVTLASFQGEMGPTSAAWSRDGSRLAFSGQQEGRRRHAFVVQRDGSGLRNVSEKLARNAHWPDLSPDGRKLLWVTDLRGRIPIMLTDLDSGETVELTRDKVTANEAPRWSPDGRQIVFAGVRDALDVATNDVFVMNADGTDVRNLSRHPGEDFDPKWSADGRSVVFASLRSGTSLLYEADLMGSGVRPLSLHTSHDMDHAVRPVAAAKP